LALSKSVFSSRMYSFLSSTASCGDVQRIIRIPFSSQGLRKQGGSLKRQNAHAPYPASRALAGRPCTACRWRRARASRTTADTPSLVRTYCGVVDKSEGLDHGHFIQSKFSLTSQLMYVCVQLWNRAPAAPYEPNITARLYPPERQSKSHPDEAPRPAHPGRLRFLQTWIPPTETATYNTPTEDTQP
jgi:hypothetical protein